MRDPLPLAVALGRRNEAFFEFGEVGFGLHSLQLVLEVEALLDEVEPSERVSIGQTLLDGVEALGDGIRRALPTPLRTVLLQRFKVEPYSATLLTALRQRLLMLVGHRRPPSLGRRVRSGCRCSASHNRRVRRRRLLSCSTSWLCLLNDVDLPFSARKPSTPILVTIGIIVGAHCGCRQ